MSFQNSSPRVAGQDSDIIDIIFPSSDVSRCLLDVGLCPIPGKQMYGNSESIKSWIDAIDCVSLVDSPALLSLTVSCRPTTLSSSRTIPMVPVSLNSLRILSEHTPRILRSPTSLNRRAMSRFPSMRRRGLQKCSHLPTTTTVMKVVRGRLSRLTRSTSLFLPIALGIVYHHPVLDRSRPTNSAPRYTQTRVPVMSAKLSPSRSFSSLSSTKSCAELCPATIVQNTTLVG